MPQLAALYDKYKDQGFHIVGLECQGSAAAQIKSLCESKNATYQVTTGGDLRGANVRGIPHGFLFGADGKMLANDPGTRELEGLLKDALAEAVAAMAGPGPYTKLAGLANQVKTGQGLGSVLKQVRAKTNSPNAEEAAEAKTMLEHLGGAAQKMLDSALAAKATDPLGALEKLKKVSVMFAGDEIGDTARKEASALEREPAVRKEVEAENLWKQVEAIQGRLRPAGQSKDPSNAQFVSMNKAAIQQMLMGCQTILQRYPGTKAAEKAQAMLKAYQ